ncbi:MAG: hypothetical protein WAK18_02155 [Nocardioidaceae bacterium]
MSVSRRNQRSLRVSVAVLLLVAAAAVVVFSVSTSTSTGAAAIVSLLLGASASRLVYTEVTHTRRAAARERAALSREFGEAMTRTHTEHAAFTTTMTERIAHRDSAIIDLNGTIRLAEQRAAEAENEAQLEGKRASEAEERLSAMFEELLVDQPPLLVPEEEALAGVGIPEAADLPTIIDLLAWESRAHETLLESRRQQA